MHNSPDVLKELAEDLNLPFEHHRSLAKLSLIVEGHNSNDIVNKVFSCLIHQKICPRYWCVENGIRVSVWISAAELQEAAQVLHQYVRKRDSFRAGMTHNSSRISAQKHCDGR